MLSEHTSTQARRLGVVTCKYRGQYIVQENGAAIPCSISTLLRKQLIYPIADPNSRRRRVLDVHEIDMVDPLAIGDQVRFVPAEDGSGHITEVLPRRNQLTRLAAGSSFRKEDAHLRQWQVMAANVDQVVPLLPAAQPGPSWALLDRYLATAEAAGIPALICITKLDLVRPGQRDDLAAGLEVYRQIGYPVILSSAVDGVGIEALQAAFTGRFSILMGKSGVGKSSLLNAIEPGLGLKVNAVREKDGRGRHTTTHLELFPLAGGGGVVDTPGMREFGLWGIAAEEVAFLFPELRPYLGACRFGANCRHEHEPGCAIQAALAEGRIAPHRFESYRKLAEEAA